MNSVAPDLVLLGNLFVDDIVLHDGTTLMCEPGGAILHAALAATLWGAKVSLVSVAGTDYPRKALDALADRDVDLSGVRQLERPGGRAWLLYEAGVRRVIVHLDCPTHMDCSPTLADIPKSFEAARFFHLAPMPIGRQQELAEGLASEARHSSSSNRAFVSLDPYELVRDDNLDQWQQILAHIDAFFPSEDEMRLSTDPAETLRRIGGKRLRFVALKRGALGGNLLDFHSGHVPWKSRAKEWLTPPARAMRLSGDFWPGCCSMVKPRARSSRGL